MKVRVTDNFRKMTTKAILSIALFAAVYIALISLALLLTGLCAYAGIMMIAFKPMFVTIMLGVGLISMGILVLIFLVKFIFKKHITDRTHLMEITASQEPKLFKFILEVVNEAQTDFPKKIYLSSDVNASVFYDSSFWSMFFPIKKNLQIGLGLMNSVSESEFKAILAHEFGHFSQRSMKIGSYVYNVNQVIYNMLYDNDSYEELAQKVANVSEYLAFFVSISIRIVQGIQWVLRKIYTLVNLSYMSLSREMEFHADEVAANIAGSKPLISSLLRLDLADHSYNEVLNFYGGKIDQHTKTRNIFPLQQFVMNFLGKESKLTFENNLPKISVAHFSKYNKSKLVIKNQWASHPSTEDRIAKLEELNIQTKVYHDALAISLLENQAGLELLLTEKLFSSVAYSETPNNEEIDKFMEEYVNKYKENSFHEIYNGYYDNRGPSYFDFTNPVSLETDKNNLSTLFSDELLDKIYTAASLERDILTVNQIASKNYGIKTFDYDGIKYKPEDCSSLSERLNIELIEINSILANNDLKIYKYFLDIALEKGKDQEFRRYYQFIFELDTMYVDKNNVYKKLVESTAFIHETTPFDIIQRNMSALKIVEADFKKHIRSILEDEIFAPFLTQEARESFESYLSRDWNYFITQTYDNSALDTLFTSMHFYHYILANTYYKAKQGLLEFQITLEETKTEIQMTP